MKPTIVALTFLIIAKSASGISAATEAPGFDTYRVILDRSPFGDESPDSPAADQASTPASPMTSFARSLKLCAMTRLESLNIFQVGLVDTISKKNYFLKIGDEEDGICLVDVDYAAEKALLRKGSEEAWISLTDGGGVSVASVPAAPPLPAAGVPGVASRQGAIPPSINPHQRGSAMRGSRAIPGMPPSETSSAEQIPSPADQVVDDEQREREGPGRRDRGLGHPRGMSRGGSGSRGPGPARNNPMASSGSMPASGAQRGPVVSIHPQD